MKTTFFHAAPRAALSLGIALAASTTASAHVTVISPNGGEVLQAGSTFQIEWTIAIAHNLQNWDIWYSTTGANGPWIPVAMDLPAGSQQVGSPHDYLWTVPDTPSNQVRVRVRMDNTGTDYYDISDSNLSIVPGCCGTSYCGPAVANSSGNSATISATGSDLAGGNPLNLAATGLPLNQFGYFLASETQAFIQQPGNSQGNLCLGGTIARFNQQVQNSGATGEFDIDVDTLSIPLSPPTAIMAGETWSFTAWFRDDNPGPTSNFTDGVAILFT